VSSLYTAVATDVNSNAISINRPELRRNRQDTTNLGNILKTDPDFKWLNS